MSKKPKILRLHTATETDTHWHKTSPLNHLQIQTIADPADAHYSMPITSIPSPFGRMHLVEDAFEKINASANNDLSKLDGQSIYHRLVSEMLDIAELFFNFDDLNNSGLQLDVLVWDVKEKIMNLKRSEPAHRLLGETLELFLLQAPQRSNMSAMEKMYILRMGYKVVGGTSPSTLFFSTPNEENITPPQPLKIGTDVLFDYVFYPLYKRDEAFQKAFYLFFEAHPQLKTQMPLVWQYMTMNLAALNRQNYALWNEINAYQGFGHAQALNRLRERYAEFTISGPGTVALLTQGVYLYKNKVSLAGGIESDFVIGSYSAPGVENTKYQGATKPLVLQNQFFYDLQYVANARWDGKTQVPYNDDRSLEQRTLPNFMKQYPYLTVSDFLEPTLVRLPYLINDTDFITGTLFGFSKGNKSQNIAPDSGFMLPLKKAFFDYFDVADLERTLPNGESVLKFIKIDANTVRVELRLPIKSAGQYILLDRTYKLNAIPRIDQTNNEGSMVDAAVNLGLMPLLREVREKRMVVIEREPNEREPYQVALYTDKSGNPVSADFKTLRSQMAKGHQATSAYSVIHEPFDYIHLQKGQRQGIIIPRYTPWMEGTKAFTFAVDFGTTNSHIEYSIEGSMPQEFDITTNDVQLRLLNHPDWDVTPREIQVYPFFEMIPSVIGTEFVFPTRTALAETEGLEYNSALAAFADLNPAMYYEKYRSLPQSIVSTNIKWGNTKSDEKGIRRVENYIESLMVMMRNKVLLNGGQLSKTQVVWFFPASMSHHTLGGLNAIWNRLYEKYFPNAKTLIRYSESEAPYYYRADAVPSTKPVAGIDIGGGSTDIVVFKDAKPLYFTSVKFAGNILFGNGYQKGPGLNNGFVTFFSKYVKNFLDTNYYQLLNLNEVFEELNHPNKGFSADLISFFFSIDRNHQVKQKKLDAAFSFTKLLQNDQNFKIAYFVFFSAIVYHLAKLMKSLQLEMPQHIFLNGNGSRILGLLDISGDWAMLEQLAMLIFQKVYGQPYNGYRLEFHLYDKPKEATCKGGIKRAQSTHSQDMAQLVVLLGDSEGTVVGDAMIGAPGADLLKRMKYKEANEGVEQKVVEEMRSFLRLLSSLKDEFRVSNLGMQAGKMEEYCRHLESNIDGFLRQGLTDRLASTDSEEIIEESLFFYPLVGALHRLILDIGQGKI